MRAATRVQAATLRRQPEVVVATPGRLIDHLRNSQGVGLEDLAVLVLDEADRWECVWGGGGRGKLRAWGRGAHACDEVGGLLFKRWAAFY